MPTNKLSRDELLKRAEISFNKKDYANSYKYCSELMKGKTASIVVYMQCMSSLNLRKTTKESVDEQIRDTLLLAAALDNFFLQSGMKNKNIETYVRDIVFCLMTSLIENIQKRYKFSNRKRSLKQNFSHAQDTISNLRMLKEYDFSKFTSSLPDELISFVRETGDKLISFVSNSINIMEDPTNNWIYEDDSNDLYERIAAYKTALYSGELVEEESYSVKTGENSYSMQGDEIDAMVEEISEKEKPEILRQSIEDIDDDEETMVRKEENQVQRSDFSNSDFENDFSESNIKLERISREENGTALRPIDIVIGILILLFVLALAAIVIYFIKPEFFSTIQSIISLNNVLM